MKYLGNLPDFNIIHSTADRYDYVNTSDPAVDTNPSTLYASWLNASTGELFHCTDNATGANTWVGNNGVVFTPTLSFPFTSGIETGWVLTGTAAFDATSQSLQLTETTDSTSGYATYALSISSYFLLEAEVWSGGGDGADGIMLQFKDVGSVTLFWVYIQEYLDKIQFYNNDILRYDPTVSNLDNSTWTSIKLVIERNCLTFYWNGTAYIIDCISTEQLLSITKLSISGHTGGLNNYHRIRNINLTYA